MKSYQMATIVYDYTVEFCRRYILRTSRTVDQMEQAARSGKQNIVEGCESRTSEEIEIKLLGAARFSLGELVEDYEDFLRQRSLSIWNKDHPRAVKVRGLVYRQNISDKSCRSNWSDMSNKTYAAYETYLDDPENAANAAICLIHQAKYLLDKQIDAAEKKFVQQGGYQEQLRDKRKKEKLNLLKKQELEGEMWLAEQLERLKRENNDSKGL